MNHYVVVFSDDGLELWTGRIDGRARMILLPPMDWPGGTIGADGDDREDRKSRGGSH